METVEKIEFSKKIVEFNREHKALVLKKKKFRFTLLANTILIVGLLPFLSIIQTPWQEISSYNILLNCVLLLLAVGLSIYIHRCIAQKNLLVFDGKQKCILRGKIGIPFQTIKGIGVKEHIHYDREEINNYSYELWLRMKDGSHISVHEHSDKYKIDTLQYWLKEII